MSKEPREVLMRFEGGLADGRDLAIPEPAPDEFSWTTVGGELVAGSPPSPWPDDVELGSLVYRRLDGGGPDVYHYGEPQVVPSWQALERERRRP